MSDDHQNSSAVSLQRKSLQKNLRHSALATAISLSLLGPAQAATIQVDDSPCTLINAITSANIDSGVGGCTAGVGADTLELQPSSVHTLTAVNSTDADGPNGLPLIASDITINGNGSTIERNSAGTTPAFRLFKVEAAGTLTLNNVTLSNGLLTGTGMDGSGGAILNRGTITLNDNTISGNSTVMSGGGISNQAGTATLNNSVVSDNHSFGFPSGPNSYLSGRGGGLYAISSSNITLNDSTVKNNTAAGTGGGIRGGMSSITLSNSTLSGNEAKRGGGLYDSSAGVGLITLTNSTISGNSASQSGGALLIISNFVEMSNVTVTGNSATVSGGNLYLRGATNVTLGNTIIGNSEGGTDCFSPDTLSLTETGNNWFEDNTCGTAKGDPGLDVLADNGGPTWTHALLPGSGAIDGGDNTICSAAPVNNLDQRGISRLNQGSYCDIGAFEVEVSVDETSFMVIPLPGGKTAVIPL